MSEASRQRWLHVKNRLEELRTKHGEPLEDPPESIDLEPSWRRRKPAPSTPARQLECQPVPVLKQGAPAAGQGDVEPSTAVAPGATRVHVV